MKCLKNTTVIDGSTRIHERNYRLLMRLLSSIEPGPEMGGMTFRDNNRLDIKVIEYTRYTTTLELSKCIGKNGHLLPDLSMRVRAYHDASVAEVIAYQGLVNIPPPYMVRSTGRYQKDEKKQINQLMYELLRLCITGEGKSVLSGYVNI